MKTAERPVPLEAPPGNNDPDDYSEDHDDYDEAEDDSDDDEDDED